MVEALPVPPEMLEKSMGKKTIHDVDYETLEKAILKHLNSSTPTPYMVPFWVERIMALVKAWAENEINLQKL